MSNYILLEVQGAPRPSFWLQWRARGPLGPQGSSGSAGGYTTGVLKLYLESECSLLGWSIFYNFFIWGLISVFETFKGLFFSNFFIFENFEIVFRIRMPTFGGSVFYNFFILGLLIAVFVIICIFCEGWYGRLDTLNSKNCPLFQILDTETGWCGKSEEEEEQ